MKKLFNQLMNGGKLDIQVNYHKGFNETAEQYINTSREFNGIDTGKMIKTNTIIRIEFLPHDKPMNATAYSHDLELALKDAYNQYLLWMPQTN